MKWWTLALVTCWFWFPIALLLFALLDGVVDRAPYPPAPDPFAEEVLPQNWRRSASQSGRAGRSASSRKPRVTGPRIVAPVSSTANG